MNRVEAHFILNRPLTFGNERQIRAVRFMEALEEAKESQETPCPACAGSGEVECECPECNDVHTKNCAECDGDGVLITVYRAQRIRDPRQLWLFPEMFAWADKPWDTVQ